MAFQQSDLDAIDATIASGVLEVRFADNSVVRYQSLDQLLAARNVVSQQLAATANASRGIRRQRFGAFRNGF